MSERGIRAGVRRLLRLQPRTQRSIHDDVDEELDSYLEARVDYLIARGMTRDDARTEALRRLGIGVDEARRRLHQSAERREARMKFSEQLSDVVGDLRYAARGLIRRPAFTIVAVLTLAVGIGATTAIFSAVYALLLRPLPYQRAGDLMIVSLVTPPRDGRPGRVMVWSYPKYIMYRDAQRSFSDLALYTPGNFTLTSGDVEQVQGELVGAHYLQTLGVRTVRGHDFDAGVDAVPGNGPRQVIISDALWQRRYNADPRVVGRSIEIDRAPYDIIGVAPQGFLGLSGSADFFMPITTTPADQLNQAQSHSYFMIARRRATVSAAQAMTETAALGARVNDAFVDPFSSGRWTAKAQSLNDARIPGSIKRSLYILFGAVAFVLLIACANVANLLIGRATMRRREIAVRLAIGAGRARLVRLLLTESVLLSVIGGVASLIVAYWGVSALSGVNPATTLRLQRSAGFTAIGFSSIHLDLTAVAFAFGAALVVGVLFGLVPALHATRASVSAALKEGAVPAGRLGPRWLGARRLLVVSEVALALVLLAGSGLLVRSLARMLSVDTGFDARNVLTLRVTMPPGAVPRDSLAGLYTQLLDRLGALPGVANVGAGNCAPLSGGCSGTIIEFRDRPTPAGGRGPSVGVSWSSPRWFETLRIPLKRGRMYSDADRFGGPKVVVINEAAAKTFWPDEDPVGKMIGIGMGGFDLQQGGAEVVGIVADVRQSVDSSARPEVYVPTQQSPRAGQILFIRAANGNAAALGPSVRRIIRDVAPQFPIYDMRLLDERTAGATAAARFNTALLTLFAGVALSLAVIGIYGVMSLAVSQRTREFGIRMALGADQRRVRGMVVREGLALAVVGGALGLVGALASTRLLQSQLFGVTTSDPVTYVAIVALLGSAAVLASWIPARRATRVQPTEALRE